MAPTIHKHQNWAVLRLPDVQLICNMDKLTWTSTQPVRHDDHLLTFVFTVPRKNYSLAPNRIRFVHLAKVIARDTYHIYKPAICINRTDTESIVYFMTENCVGRRVCKPAQNDKLYRL